MAANLTASFIFFAKYTEPLRVLVDIIPRSSGHIHKCKVLDASVLEGDMVKLSLEEWERRQFQKEMALYCCCTLIHPWNWLSISWSIGFQSIALP